MLIGGGQLRAQRVLVAESDAGELCFHCGEPIVRSAGFRALIDGTERTMCCAGCKAVAEAIAGAGLSAFYEHRERAASKSATQNALADDQLAAYDSSSYQRGLVQAHPDGTVQALLHIDGVTCAACVWLIERRLQHIEGVLEASMNFTSMRVLVRWDPAIVRLSAIIRAVRAIGYGAEPFDGRRSEAQGRTEQRRSLWRLFVAAFGMMQVMMYAVPAYVAADGLPADVDRLMRWASLVLTLPVVTFAAGPFFSGAWRDLRARTVGMNVPIAIGIAVTFVASVHSTLTGQGAVYFDSIAMFVFLLLAARHLETIARMRIGEALDRVARLQPAFAARVRPAFEGEATEHVAVADLVPGDRVVVGAGEAIPADGVVESGASMVNESLLTGEARGVSKRAGDGVIGGSVNLSSRLTMRVERVGAETAIAGIGRLLERAIHERPRIAQLADRIAKPFTIAVLVIATAAAIVWWFIDPAQALPIAVTILVITCPCALSLATPAAVAAAAGSLARIGVLVARGHALDTLTRATHFVFDKTGTVTTGKLAMIGVMPLAAESRKQCLELSAALEAGSRHPVGIALLRAAQRAGAAPAQALADLHDVAGQGIEARWRNRAIRIGRPEFVAEIVGRPLPAELAFVADQVQVVALGESERWIGLFTLGDTIRPTARALVRELRSRGRSVWLLSGDRRAVVEHIGRELDVDGVVAEAHPEQKLRFVRDMQKDGAVVAMIGDGVNDAPVLAGADVSLAMAEGADAAQHSADIIIPAGGLHRLADALEVARRSERIIKQNLAWALGYNAIAIPAALAGWVSPLVASIGMAASSAIVVLNALRAAHPALWQPQTANAIEDLRLARVPAYGMRTM